MAVNDFESLFVSLPGVQEKLGVMNKGTVYALWDYEAQSGDELSFREGDALTIMSRRDDSETEWWWAKLNDKEGYVPRNLLGVGYSNILLCLQIFFSNLFCKLRKKSNLLSLQLYPRIKPRQRSLA